MARPKQEAGPLSPPPAPTPTWTFAIIPTKRLGQTEYSIVACLVVGDRVERTAVVPESNWPRMSEALRDFNRCAVRAFQFRDVERLLAGKV